MVLPFSWLVCPCNLVIPCNIVIPCNLVIPYVERGLPRSTNLTYRWAEIFIHFQNQATAITFKWCNCSGNSETVNPLFRHCGVIVDILLILMKPNFKNFSGCKLDQNCISLRNISMWKREIVLLCCIVMRTDPVLFVSSQSIKTLRWVTCRSYQLWIKDSHHPSWSW